MELTDRERALFEEVLRTPDDPTPRLMLSDALQERGQAFGEVLLLAATESLPARERKLRERHAQAFYGPLLESCDKATFANGLLDTAWVRVKRRGLASDPRWGSVRSLKLLDDSDLAARFVSEVRLPWLDHLAVPGGLVLDALFATELAPRSLAVGYVDRRQLTSLADPACLPSLEELFLHRVELPPLEVTRQSGVLQRPLRVLGVGARSTQWAGWLRLMEHTRAEEVRLLTDSWRYRIDPTTWRWTLVPLRRYASRDEALRPLRELPRRFRDTITVESWKG